MKRAAIAVIVALLVAVTSAANLTQQVQNTLTAINSVPTKAQLDSAFDSPQLALQNLSSIATDADGSNDIGIRLRAIHALGKYCGDPTGAPPVPCSSTEVAHQSLTQIINVNAAQTTGAPVLLLRACIETLGTMNVSADVNVLVPLLNHSSRDIRAATARALRDLCNSQAITPLRIRYTDESTEQVKLAISEALRILGQCTPNP